jgi:hypothetical protein
MSLVRELLGGVRSSMLFSSWCSLLYMIAVLWVLRLEGGLPCLCCLDLLQRDL